jgi:hypothetical protein
VNLVSKQGLDIHIFLAKQKKLSCNSLTSNLANFSNLANLPPPHAYLRAERERSSGITCKFKWGSSFLSGALRFLTGLLVCLAGLFLFYQVQMANSWRESIFSLAIYFNELLNHDICQVNFGKLLEILLDTSNPVVFHIIIYIKNNNQSTLLYTRAPNLNKASLLLE